MCSLRRKDRMEVEAEKLRKAKGKYCLKLQTSWARIEPFSWSKNVEGDFSYIVIFSYEEGISVLWVDADALK